MPDSFLFQTERIFLRPFEPADLPALQAYLNHPELAGRRYIPWSFPEDLPLSAKQAEGIYNKWCEGENVSHLAVISQDKQEIIGHTELDWGWDPHCPFVAVLIAPSHQRQGYGSEVLRLLLRHLFENTPAHNVHSWMADWNQAARRFAQEHGFRESGRSRHEGLRQGKYFDAVLVDILRPEWQASQGGKSHAA